jgi:hypothetical protein
VAVKRPRAQRWLLLALCAAVLACARPPADPTSVVERYFAYRSRDPLRLLLLLTPEFHRAHALTLDAWLRGPQGAALLASRSRAAPEPSPWTLWRAEASWLDAQEALHVHEAASRLRVTLEASETNGERARVRSRVIGASGLPFTQVFQLVRSPETGDWRIDAIEQQGLAAANLFDAYAAYPCHATLDRLYASGSLR